MTGLYIFVVALATSFIYLWLVRNAEVNVEGWKWVAVSFVVGATIAVGASILVETWVLDIYPLTGLLLAVLVAPLVEEAFKALPSAFIPYRYLDERIDGVILGGASALGFAFVETTLMATANIEVWGQVVFWRAIFSTPLHLVSGALFGYGVVSLRMRHGSAFVWMLLGLAFHGLFNFAILGIGDPLLTLGAMIAILVLGCFLVYAMIEGSNGVVSARIGMARPKRFYKRGW